THLLAERKAGRLSVVVLDEAQAVSIEVLEQLRLLSNLETSTEKLLRLVLVGQPQLAALLVDPALAQLNQRITLRWHLGPLTAEETTAYVRHRLKVASGGKVTDLFTRPALRLVHRFSRGVPRLVNMIAHRALLVAYVARRRRVNARAVLQAYREIGTVPLRRWSPVRRRVEWAAAVATVVLAVITLGVPRLERRLPAALSDGGGRPSPAAPAVGEPPPSLAPAPLAVAATTSPAPAPPAPRVAPLATPTELEQRLAALDARRSARAALDAILAAWRVPGLGADEAEVPAQLEPMAWRRGLEVIPLTGNLSMVRLLDLPALLELRVPGATEPRYAGLLGVDNRGVRPDHGGRSPELPALSPAGGRLPGRPLHAHRALRRRRQLSPAVAGAGRGSALVSSILEALRELEASKAPAAPGTGTWTEEPSRSRSALETLGIVAGGLAIGAAAFALVIWLAGPAVKGVAESPGGAAPGSDAARPAAPPPQASEPAAGSAAPPAWLGRAEPPRARVAPGASPSEGIPAASRAPQAPAQPSGAASPAQDDSVVAVSAISYS